MAATSIKVRRELLIAADYRQRGVGLRPPAHLAPQQHELWQFEAGAVEWAIEQLNAPEGGLPREAADLEQDAAFGAVAAPLVGAPFQFTPDEGEAFGRKVVAEAARRVERDKSKRESHQEEEPQSQAVEPLDLFGDTSLAGSPDFPLDDLPPVIAEFAADEAERLGVDPAMLAIPATVVAAAAIDDRYVLQPKAHDTRWNERPCLWTAAVAEIGERKTPSLEAVVTPPREIELEWAGDDQAANTRYELRRRVYAKAVEEYVRRAARGDDASPPEEPDKPPVRRLIVGDSTTEALSEILVNNPRGVLVYQDELVGWLASMDAYRAKGAGKDRAVWLQAYNGGPAVVDRVKRGRVRVENLSVCILGGIQPGPMRRLAGKLNDDGLFQRFTVFFPRPCTDGVDRPPNERAIRNYHNLIRELVYLPTPATKRVFTLSREAQVERVMVAKVARNIMILPNTSPAFRGHLGKWEGLFARLALVFHLIEAAAAGVEPPSVVAGSTGARAARLLVNYLLPNAARFYVELGEQDHLTHARWIAGHILAHGLELITARGIGRAYHALRNDRGELGRAMECLAVAGWVEPVNIDAGPPTKWRVNPRVHAVFAERAAREKCEREQIRDRIKTAARELGLVAEARA